MSMKKGIQNLVEFCTFILKNEDIDSDINQGL